MSRLHTVSLQGYLDFISGGVFLPQYEMHDKEFLERVFSNANLDNPDEKSVKSILIHEQTHFMDFFTTNWGVEFVLRKGKLCRNGVDELCGSSLSVFMLNASEIFSHSHLKEEYLDVSLTSSTSIRHQVEHVEGFGAVVSIRYYSGEDEICKVPLSMLSVLEAHATAEEYLYLVNKASNSDNSLLDIRFIRNDYNKMMSDKELSEYSLLLNIAHIHYDKYLCWRSLLRFVSAICRFTLDVSGVGMASLGQYYKKRFLNIIDGSDICMDMARGMSRPLISFVTLLHIYEWLQSVSEEDREIFISIIKDDPFCAINIFYETNLRVSLNRYLDDVEFDCCSSMIDEDVFEYDKDMVLEASVKNRYLLSRKCLSDCSSELVFSPIILGDNTLICSSVSLSQNHANFILKSEDLYSKIDSFVYSNKSVKFSPVRGTGLDFFSSQVEK